jgi:hypothetical protein
MSYKWRIALLLAVLVISFLMEPFVFNEGFNAKKPYSEQEIKEILAKDPKVKQMLEQTK